MNLAWSNLNREKPDVATAEQQAQAALKIVPNWHYVKDILLPQIQAAETPPPSKPQCRGTASPCPLGHHPASLFSLSLSPGQILMVGRASARPHLSMQRPN